MFLDLDTTQLIHASAFQGIELNYLMIQSSGLQEIPDLTQLRNTLEVFELECGTNCSLSVESGHFSRSSMLRTIKIENAGLTDILWLLSLRKQAIVISVAHNNIATIAPIYGVRFEKLAYLNLNHNLIITVDMLNFEMPKLLNLKLEENEITHFDLTHCNFNGSAPMLNIFMFGNPLNCNARWQWLYNSIIVREDIVYGVVKCGKRKVFIMRTDDLTCWNPEAQAWEKLVQREDLVTSTKPEYHGSMMHRLLINVLTYDIFTTLICRNNAHIFFVMHSYTRVTISHIHLVDIFSHIYATFSWPPHVKGIAWHPINRIKTGSR